MRASTPESDFPWFRRKTSWFFVLGLMMGIAMSAVFALGVWVGSRGGSRPFVPAAPAGRITKPDKPTTPENSLLLGSEEKPATKGLPRPPEPGDTPILPASAIATVPLAPRVVPERFVLRDAPRHEPEPFFLPTDTWFALGGVSADEPAEAEPQVCRVDRSLDTALTWASSPAEASERAAREGKLVFLIHVSGNFEDPGFT